MIDVTKRNNVSITGKGNQAMLFAHGYGCDQNMWRFVAPEFEKDYKVVLFDLVGNGQSDLTLYTPEKYKSLHGYAEDILEICEAHELKDVIYVGHSVSAMIGVLAAIERPDLFSKLVLVGPSPRYINDGEYIGGFDKKDIEDLLNMMDQNYLGWSSSIAPAIMGNADRPQLGEELTNSFCRTDPTIARQFARVTFLSDNRADLPKLKIPSLVLQCSEDIIAPEVVGKYVHDRLENSKFEKMEATGHCPNLSAPEETIRLIRKFLNG